MIIISAHRTPMYRNQNERGNEMARKLFCEISPLTYRIAVEKNILQRRLRDAVTKVNFAKVRSSQPLCEVIYEHKSLIRRRLGKVDMQLQENKAVNLAIAAPLIDGILIRPRETFSFWKLVGRDSRKRGFLEGMVIRGNKPDRGIGGGLCQFSNLIHWMVLHSELTITEHHHHDRYDLFPDFGRKVPFGTGTSIMYNYLDYRVRNDTDATYQIMVRTDGEFLIGELRSDKPQKYRYDIKTKDHRFVREGDDVYRCGTVVRKRIDVQTDAEISEEIIRENHALVMYDTSRLKISEK